MSKNLPVNPKEGASEASFLIGQLLKNVEGFKEKIGQRLDVNETDYRAVTILLSKGPLTAGELGDKVGLTSGSTTTMINRLIKVGHATKKSSEQDKRSAVIEIKPDSAVLAASLISPILKMSDDAMKGMSISEIETVLIFLRQVNQRAEEILADLAGPGGAK